MEYAKGVLVALVLVAMMSLALVGAAFADGTDGSITIDNATVGVTYKAYKILDATIDNTDPDNKLISYYTTAAMKDVIGATGSPFVVAATADSEGRYAVTSTADVATISSWITSNLSSFTAISATSGTDSSDKATSTSVAWTGLAYGYYYLTSGLGSVVTIDNANPSVTVKDKNPQVPNGPEKVITAEDAVIANSDATFDPGIDSNDAAVGSVESFKITYTATNWVTTGSGTSVESKKVLKFYIDDQPNNMTIDPDTVAVTVGSTSVISAGAVVDSTNHPATISVASGDEGKLSITIDWVDSEGESIYSAADGQANINVTLTYNATILAAAATENADNTVTVLYDRTGDNKVTVGDDETETDTWKFKLEKIDKTSKEGLKGAKFELKLGSTKVAFVANSDKSVYTVSTDSSATTTIDMGENTTIEIRGLDKQAYVLNEIEAPKGYNLMTDDVDVTVDDLTKADETIPTAKKISVENIKGTMRKIIIVAIRSCRRRTVCYVCFCPDPVRPSP